jgi:threonine/homoserine/homoserine lactone efflux protein
MTQAFPVALILASVPFMTSMGFTPGPNNIMVATSGVNFGFRATLPHILGVTFGYPFMLLLVGLGLAKIFTLLPATHAILTYVCIAYLLYLAWRIATAAAIGEGRRTARPIAFWQAVAFQWVNVKGWVAALSVVTTYTLVGPPLIPQVLALAAIALLVTLGSMLTWSMGGTVLRRYLRTDRHRRLFNYSMATLLLLSIVPVLFE